METLKRAREEFEFYKVYTYDGKIMYKDAKGTKMKSITIRK